MVRRLRGWTEPQSRMAARGPTGRSRNAGRWQRRPPSSVVRVLQGLQWHARVARQHVRRDLDVPARGVGPRRRGHPRKPGRDRRWHVGWVTFGPWETGELGVAKSDAARMTAHSQRARRAAYSAAACSSTGLVRRQPAGCRRFEREVRRSSIWCERGRQDFARVGADRGRDKPMAAGMGCSKKIRKCQPSGPDVRVGG